MGIGSPPQKITLLIDTGSSELWVNPDCATAPTDLQKDQCQQFGKYDPQQSTSSRGPFGKKNINYGDPSDPATHTTASIQYMSDDISFGDASITNQTFGVVTSSTGQGQGVLGLGPDLKNGFGGSGYNLVLSTMAQQGLINSAVFSLDLRHMQSKTGAVIYGGIDRSKFSGSLQRLPFVRGAGGEFRLAAQMSSVGVTRSSTSSTFKLQGMSSVAMFDSGSSFTRLKKEVAAPILQGLGATKDDSGNFIVPCSVIKTPTTVDFGFGNNTIRVPLSDFVVQTAQGCYVGMSITTETQILGDTVLRAGYFVFDWDNEAMHVAQAADCGASDIVAVGKGKDAVPDLVGNCKQSDSVLSEVVSTAAAGPVQTIGTGSIPTFPTQTVVSARPTGARTNTKSTSGGAGKPLVSITWMLASTALAIFYTI